MTHFFLPRYLAPPRLRWGLVSKGGGGGGEKNSGRRGALLSEKLRKYKNFFVLFDRKKNNIFVYNEKFPGKSRKVLAIYKLFVPFDNFI